jgi:hypothetical protein
VILKINSDFFLNSINLLISVMDMQYVFSDVGTAFVNFIVMNFGHQSVKVKYFEPTQHGVIKFVTDPLHKASLKCSQ